MALKLVMMPPQSEVTRGWTARLREAVPGARIAAPETLEGARSELQDAEAAYGTVPDDLLAGALKLRWLQAPAAAPPAGYYSPDLIQHPVTVTNFRGIYNDHISAHILAFVLAFARGFHRYGPQGRARRWQPHRSPESTVYLPEATALVVGVGGIGGETARRLAAFGVRVLGLDARLKTAPEGVTELHPPEALDALLPEADFVILTVPHTPQTEGMMHAARFRRMKRTAFLINIGRGATVKLDDLTAALQGGHIAGAGLDVFETEPLPAEHPLWEAPGALLTPHVADVGPYLDERRFEILLGNLRRFTQREPLLNVVDKARWF